MLLKGFQLNQRLHFNEKTVRDRSSGLRFVMGLFGKIFGGDNDNYKGDLRNDVPHGKGTKKFSMVIFMKVNGKMDLWKVKALLHLPMVLSIRGEVKDNNKHGIGTLTPANGGEYTGSFKNGSFDGKGELIFPDGAEYEGEFKDNQKHGKGTYIHADGKKFHR